ncbi:epoxyqueuosine reductase [Methylohalomonas lacus]|uniref:Epoxyqueuosine reductase n=1 Tax=Methylohalomonas lacus TaxID=398773 RepID=A0AAE3HGW7_9GAMM|nr:tRNA epoxyqueuosine(34) reductase QueG [Methylohalomonas lacus]MCS3902115.1 epoxyqueuosine reductase [Methylohalomonas lacus]
MSPTTDNPVNSTELARRLRDESERLGFQALGISGVDLSRDEAYLEKWLAAGYHGEMDYMSRHGRKRSRPDELVPGTIRVISVRMDYLPPQAEAPHRVLLDKQRGYVSRYALGRDYHKVMRSRLQKLADWLQNEVGTFGYRAFTDSAPVLEKALARNAGLGWIGKHSNLIHPQAGSWFFLGELYTDLALPVDDEFATDHCGSCTACMDICPTQAIVGPYQVDARRCISYLTIELRGSIPVEFRKAIGNRIYGCDDCQLICPWNKFAHPSDKADFEVRHGLDSAALVDLFAWDEATFQSKTAGSAIRRIGHDCWLRNIAVALGNAPTSDAVIGALESRRNHASAMVREHVDWALAQHGR